MSSQEYPNVDGVAPSWADIQVSASIADGALVDVADIKAISTGRTLEVGTQMRAGKVHKRTRGSVTTEASITFYRDGFQRFVKKLKEVAPREGSRVLIGLVEFDVLVQHTVPGDDTVYMRKIIGARVGGDTMNGAEGTDAQEVEVPLHTKDIVDIDEDGDELALL